MAKKKQNAAPAAEVPKEIVIRSVRANGRSIRFEWMHGGDAYAVTFHDNPLPSFDKAIKGLAVHVAALCELPAKDVEKIEATGITVRPLGDDNQQALIVAKKKIRKGKRVFNISTPLLAMYPGKDAETKGSDAMDPDEAKAIEKVIAESKKYITGERAQGKLALEDLPAAKDKTPDNQEQFPDLTEPGKDADKS
jgi:hypothetical protein